ncbi:acyl-CoA synthetase [Phenylobacterium montanum]|uniref:Acyl-CoA synthetase n=1 Tax=Phenylobacterium montanum TaxID=2823693 RepID=A0A975G2S1_9CAUL|nr:acyl-CoA synthetase [Caulobacter sp. S6]QUD89483.1 acyl-CoA synthetase [Caulobacter sp. S6]
MIWHLAALWELIAGAIPDEVALINGEARRSWRQFETRAASLASGLLAAGLGPDAKVAVYGLNSNEYLEAHFAAFKARAMPVNVNYRYGESELTYLLDNADAEALIFDARYGDKVAAIRSRLPRLRLLVEIDDGTGRNLPGAVAYEALIRANRPLAPIRYHEDDVYMLYTGGTTGMPKGVMYAHRDLAQAMMLGYDFMGEPRPATEHELILSVQRRIRAGTHSAGLAASPLMHGTGLWAGAFAMLNLGGAAVTIRSLHFDATELWRAVEQHRVTDMAIVGDVFARPMVSALREAQAAGRPFDLSSLRTIFSSGVMFSSEAKRGLLEFADVTLIDSMGATEGGMGSSIVNRTNPPGETAVFKMNATTKVFRDDGQEVKPGSGEIGMVANGGVAPIGYYKDPAKSAATFRVIDGHRYSFPGDYAQVAADGSIILLGRGSSCINTGGEKVFPEEVEEALKAHPSVDDCLVVGAKDERLGERVTAVVTAAAGRTVDEAELVAFARERLAGYKLPRQMVVADRIQRGPSGKPDYRWAKGLVEEAAR